MKFKLLAGAAFAAVCVASGASAQETGWYGAIDLGYHVPESIDTYSASGQTGTSSGPSNNASTLATYWDWTVENDWAGFVRLGYQFTPNWRVEAEGGYRAGDLGVVRGIGTATRQQPYGLCKPGVGAVTSSAACGSPDGSIDSWTVMANVLYDFAPDAWLNPFVGAGIGLRHGHPQIRRHQGGRSLRCGHQAGALCRRAGGLGRTPTSGRRDRSKPGGPLGAVAGLAGAQ